MTLTYKKAQAEDIPRIYDLCKQLIDQYENTAQIAYEKVLAWVRRKLEAQIDQYTAVFANGQKAGYYHFFRNEDGQMELDDLYIFPDLQKKGIGTAVVKKCLAEASEPVILYVFIRNTGAVQLYERLGFQVTETVGNTRYIMTHP